MYIFPATGCSTLGTRDGCGGKFFCCTMFYRDGCITVAVQYFHISSRTPLLMTVIWGVHWGYSIVNIQEKLFQAIVTILALDAIH